MKVERMLLTPARYAMSNPERLEAEDKGTLTGDAVSFEEERQKDRGFDSEEKKKEDTDKDLPPEQFTAKHESSVKKSLDIVV